MLPVGAGGPSVSTVTEIPVIRSVVVTPFVPVILNV
jgi:hypothetical protein